MNLPKSVEIMEVGPRDGFQNVKEWIPTELKIEIIDGLVKSNFRKIEITSFVHPKAIAQMQDAKEIAKLCLEKYGDIELNALVPNLYGAKSAWESGIREITYVISVSEAHNKANVNRTVEESFKELKNLKKELPGMKVKLDLATVFGCPFEGEISMTRVSDAISKALEMKVDSICICDTIGIANPLQVEKILNTVNQRFPGFGFSLHFHDTRGMGLSNMLVALNSGVRNFETAIGGLGGCPFAPGAAGNTATEDAVYMLECMGISTGIDLAELIKVVRKVKKNIKSDLTGHLAHIK